MKHRCPSPRPLALVLSGVEGSASPLEAVLHKDNMWQFDRLCGTEENQTENKQNHKLRNSNALDSVE